MIQHKNSLQFKMKIKRKGFYCQALVPLPDNKLSVGILVLQQTTFTRKIFQTMQFTPSQEQKKLLIFVKK